MVPSPVPLAFVSFPWFLLRLDSVRFIAAVAGLLALYWAVVTAIEKWRVYKSRSWRTVAGTTSDVSTELKDGGANGVDYYRVHFVYSYSVDGRQYSGKYHVNCVTEALSKAATEGISAGEVIVHVDPADPAKGILWEDEVWKLW